MWNQTQNSRESRSSYKVSINNNTKRQARFKKQISSPTQTTADVNPKQTRSIENQARVNPKTGKHRGRAGTLDLKMKTNDKQQGKHTDSITTLTREGQMTRHRSNSLGEGRQSNRWKNTQRQKHMRNAISKYNLII